MPLSINRTKFGFLPQDVRDVLFSMAQNTNKDLITTANPANITDNTTGSQSGATVLLVMAEPFTHVNTVADLVTKTSLDTALDLIDDAIATVGAVVRDYTGALGLTNLTLNSTGTATAIATGAREVKALTKTLSGSQGNTDVAADRVTANARIQVLANNYATVVRSWNQVAASAGLGSFTNNSGGAPDYTDLTLEDHADTGPALDNTGDCISKASADALLTAFADNVARLCAAIIAGETAAGTKVAINILP